MKNSFFLLVSLCVLVLFNACKKDQELKSIEGLQNEEILTQSRKRTCAMHDHTQKLLDDPAYKAFHKQKFERLKNIPTDRAACSEPVILPVAVHFQGVSNPDINCLRQLAQSQIDILNADYGGSNSDIAKWNNEAAPFFPGISNGETCVQFCIASKNHPSGYGLSNGDPAVTVNTTTGDNDSNWSGYINIFVQSNTGVLGYSPLGGSGNGDGVVIDANAFGSGSGCGSIAPQAPYNLGRTLTHELGHYLLLDHIWGGGCGQDDEVADTPDSADSYYDCPNLGASSCGSTDMHMNYMDYTNDACMYMFSAGQSSRMENYVSTSLQAVVNNAANVCDEGNGGGGNDPTCNDGIQNGQETGVDCGGPDCDPCNPTGPTCDDGIQNGQETGVDCGGPDCQPCITDTNCVPPVNIEVTVVNSTTAVVAFDPVAEAIEYVIAYAPIGDVNVETITTTNTVVVIEGLQAETAYGVNVRSTCADGISEGTGTTFSTSGDTGGGTCDCENGAHLELALTLDEFPEETAWELIAEDQSVVASGGDYTEQGAEITEEFCLEDGCYTFIITDAYGDGICCAWGNGDFQLLDVDQTPIANTDGDFGDFEAVDFCVEGGVIEVLEFRKAEKDMAKLSVRSPKRSHN